MGNSATGPPSENETLSLWIFVPRSHPSQDSRPLAISFAPARGTCHLATTLRQNTKENWETKTRKPRWSQAFENLLPNIHGISFKQSNNFHQTWAQSKRSSAEVPSLDVIEESPWTTQTRAKVLIKLQGLNTLQKPQDPPALTQSVLNYSVSMVPTRSWIWPNVSSSPGNWLSTTITDSTDYSLRALP